MRTMAAVAAITVVADALNVRQFIFAKIGNTKARQNEFLPKALSASYGSMMRLPLQEFVILAAKYEKRCSMK